MRIEIPSWPWALFWSKDLITLTISLTQNSKDESLSLVSEFILTGTVLSLVIGVHCLAKKSLHVLGAVFGSFSLLARCSWYFSLEELIVFDISNVRAFKDV